MPVPGGGKYRVVQTGKGPVRLHFGKGGVVNEAKNLDTGAVHSPAEFRADARKSREAFKQRVKHGLSSKGTGKHDG